jgi:hypothetical protein
MNQKELAEQAIALARKNINSRCAMPGSAAKDLEDALNTFDKGMYDSAQMWAVSSLRYSVGIFHPDYQKANTLPAVVAA